ncbi:MAG: exosortase system-associated protein, TIGR04073 family [Gammaproteobacteria bacterium]
MNKKKLLTTCLLFSFLVAGLPVKAEEQAQETDYLSSFSSKFTQGLFNTATGFVEIPKNIVNVSNEHNVFVGLTWGTLRGAMHAVSRTVVGVGELITSPIPTDDYISPPYVWERFSEDTRYFGLYIPGFWTTYGPLDDGE